MNFHEQYMRQLIAAEKYMLDLRKRLESEGYTFIGDEAISPDVMRKDMEDDSLD